MKPSVPGRRSGHPSFLWGAATSAHQVEGGNIHNDWWEWEKASRRERSGRACDHYQRYAEDFALAQELGHNAHRFSIEWSRIEPLPGQWNRFAVDHYRSVIAALQERGMVPIVTLHHFTNPRWLVKQGGWQSRRAPEFFERYVDFVVQQLGEGVTHWITINEPMVYAGHAYWTKKWPPQQRSLRAHGRAVRNLQKAHRAAYRTIHRRLPHAAVGIAKHVIDFQAARPDSWADHKLAALKRSYFNHRFFDQTKGTHDFLGLNYYFGSREQFRWPGQKRTAAPTSQLVSDLGWPVSPDGLTRVLQQMKHYELPIYITENGIADAQDNRRPDYIRDHLRAIEHAQQQGVDVRGYFHWSLLDNFEWADGFTPRFGLVAVDYNTLQRTPRASAYVYRAIIAQANMNHPAA